MLFAHSLGGVAQAVDAGARHGVASPARTQVLPTCWSSIINKMRVLSTNVAHGAILHVVLT